MLGALRDELVEVVALGAREGPQGEVVEDQEVEAREAPQAALPAALGASSGKLGKQAAGLGEEHRVATAAGQVPEGGGDVRLAHPHGPVEQHRFAALQEAQGGEVADQRRRQSRVVSEVELLEGELALEVRPADALGERLRLAPADLVFEQHLEELEVLLEDAVSYTHLTLPTIYSV